MPAASFMAKGRLIGEADALLEDALAVDSTHWAVRYTLAINHFHTPEFLGRNPQGNPRVRAASGAAGR